MLIESDIAIAAGILKTANSPLFGASRRISDIGHAIMILGITRVIDIAMALKMSAIGKQHPLTSQIWEHSRAVAEIATVVAKVLKFMDILPNIAHTTGLLHDCGLFPMLQSKPFTSSNSKMITDISTLDMDPEKSMMHSHWGYYMLKSWGLPEVVCQAVKYHHDFENIPDADTELKNLAALIILSEQISWIISNPQFEQKLKSNETHISVLDYLLLTFEDFNEIKNDIWVTQC